MNSLVRMPQSPEQLATISQSLAEYMERTQLGNEVLKVAMDLVSQFYAYGEYKALSTLAVTEKLKDAGQPVMLTSAQMEAYESLRTDYLLQMSALTRYASERTIQEAIHAPREQDSSIQRILGLLGE